MKEYTMAQRGYDYEISKGIAIQSDLDSFVLTHINWIVDDYKSKEDIIVKLMEVDNIITDICNKIQNRIDFISKYE